MPNTSNRRRTLQDGVGLVHTDLNEMQTWAKILEHDYLLGRLTTTIPLGGGAAPWLSDAALTKKLHRQKNQAMPQGTGTPRVVKSTAGLIAQWQAAPNGVEPQLLVYHLDNDEIIHTVAIGDATNPRLDIIAVKLEYEDVSETRDFKDATTLALSSVSASMSRRVKMTSQLVAGTPAASPTLPALPAGYAYYCIVKVPATFNAAISMDPTASNDFRDMTFPLGPVKRKFFQASQALYVAADFTLNADFTLTSGVAKSCYFPLDLDEDLDSKILRVDFGGAGTGFEYGIGGGSTLFTSWGTIAGVSGFDFADFTAIDLTHTCKPHIRSALPGSGAQVSQHRIKVTRTSQAVNYVAVYYK